MAYIKSESPAKHTIVKKLEQEQDTNTAITFPVGVVQLIPVQLETVGEILN